MMRRLLRFSILALSVTALLAPFEFLGRSRAEDQARRSNVTPREAQSPGTISGQLLGDDGQPVEGGIVRLAAIGTANMGPRTVHTDADGNFRFTDLQPRAYNVWAEWPGFVSEVSIDSNLRYHRIGQPISMKMVKGGVITGKVTNIDGDPAVAIPVRAIRVRDAEGRPLRSESTAGVRHTDDRGIYRIFGLRAGSYLVMVNPADPNNSPFVAGHDVVATYHPSAGREGASEVNVQVGAEVSGIDIRYRSEPGYTVSGSIIEGRDFGGYKIYPKADSRSPRSLTANTI
jgi:protocatechuate 3,4-dioxygenase beta subunit